MATIISSSAGILFPSLVNGKNRHLLHRNKISMQTIPTKLKAIRCYSSSSPKQEPEKNKKKNNNTFVDRFVKHFEDEASKLFIKGILMSVVAVFLFRWLPFLLGSRYKGVADYLDREMMIKIRISEIDYGDKMVEKVKVAKGKD